MKRIILGLLGVFLICVLFENITYILGLNDTRRYRFIIKTLYEQGVIPSSVLLEGKYCTHEYSESSFVFYGTTTNILFLADESHITDMDRSLKTYWVDLRELEEEHTDTARMINSLFKKANISFICSPTTPIFRRVMKTTTAWVILNNEEGIIIVVSYI